MKNIQNIQNSQKMLIKNNISKNNYKLEEIILKNNKVRAKSKRNSLKHKRNTTILSDNSFITISKEKKIYENNLNKKDEHNTVNLQNKKSAGINDSLNSLNNDYSNLNINEEIKNSENNINENNDMNKNKNNNKDSEPDLFLFLNYTNNNFNYTVNGDMIKKYNSMRNDYGKKKKTSVLLLKAHEHFNSAMSSFTESNSKESNEYDLESEYYSNCSINTLYKKNFNIDSENDIIIFKNKANNDSKSHKYFTNNLHNSTENNVKTNKNKNKLTNNTFISKSFYIKEKNKTLPNKEKLIQNGIKKYIKNKKKVYQNEISNCSLNAKIPNVFKENKIHKSIKSFNSKKDISVKINKTEKNENDSNENTKNKNSSKSKNIISNLKKKFNSFKLNFKNGKSDNKVDKSKDKDIKENHQENSKKNKDNNDSKNEEKIKKKIVVIKKRKNSKINNEDENSLRSLTERNSENKNIGEIMETKETEGKKDINNSNEDDLKIFEIISDAKIKSMIEYEEEKDNIKLLKENFNMNIDHKNTVDNNNKYANCLDEYSVLLKKNNSRDTFSFRPTNNDSREISEQELKNNNDNNNNDNNNNDNGNNNKILLEVEGDNMKNEAKHRIKIIKKKKKFIK